ncbi:MAG: galactokinase family protein [Eubacteriales bacterium]|nr:galactokinase family protein [Eubacteriales bacterium]
MITIQKLKENINNGSLDNKLSLLYSKSSDDLLYYKNRINNLINNFKKYYNINDDNLNVYLFSSPGRTEICGNHTDHQRGKVLTASVNCDMISLVSLNNNKTINIYSEEFGLSTIEINNYNKKTEEEHTSLSLIRGILKKISSLGYKFSGFNAYISSDVLSGSGLSSSASFEMLVAVILNTLFCNNEISPKDLAIIGQYAENIYFNKPSGLMDQMGCMIGGIIKIDFHEKNNPIFEKIKFDFNKNNFVMCIINSGSNHANLTNHYSSIPLEMESIAKAFKKEVLSEVSEEDFYKNINSLRVACGDRAILRAIHYYDDNKKVDEEASSLEKRDFNTFLKLIKESGESSFMHLQNVSSYDDPREQSVAIALALTKKILNGKGSVRVHGGGFAGTIQAFMPLEISKKFKKGIEKYLGPNSCHIMNIRDMGAVEVI